VYVCLYVCVYLCVGSDVGSVSFSGIASNSKKTDHKINVMNISTVYTTKFKDVETDIFNT